MVNDRSHVTDCCVAAGLHQRTHAAWVARGHRGLPTAPRASPGLRQVPRRTDGRTAGRFYRDGGGGTDGSILEGVGKHGDDEEISTCHATKL